LTLRAELPGFTDKDINITIEQGSLTIRGERKEDLPEGYSVHRQERGAMKFARSFNERFPGFDTDVHGLVVEKDRDGARYFVDCVKTDAVP